MAKRRDRKELDVYERCARALLEPVLGPLKEIDPGGGAVPLHDFEAELPGGLVAAIEVTSDVVRAEVELDVAARRRFSSLTLPGSARRWLVAPASDARVNDMKTGDLRLLMYEMEKQGRWGVHRHGDYRDAIVRRLRELRVESVYSWVPAGGRVAGIVMVDSRIYGGWGWNGAATGEWLGTFLDSEQGGNKLGKLDRASAAERHLVVVLDPRSPAGLCLPVGLTDLQGPGEVDAALAGFVPPQPLTHLWLLPMVADWLGLTWVRDEGWAVWRVQPASLGGNSRV
jgi:hypothetical protein